LLWFGRNHYQNGNFAAEWLDYEQMRLSLGAAGFTFAALYPDDINPTRCGGSGSFWHWISWRRNYFRDGFNIQGINTAATLLVFLAVGLISGSGHVTYQSP
jgi:putative Mg2+ transporter-C (MgtC) family protein